MEKTDYSDRLGQCYTLAANYVVDLSFLGKQKIYLVHGTINPVVWGVKWNGIDFDNPHAWVEIDNDVYDPVCDIRMRKDIYYRIYGVKEENVKRYEHQEACRLLLKHENYGPWE